MDAVEQFRAEVRANIAGLKSDAAVRRLSSTWMRETLRHKYTYNFTWLGRPIIQFPQDLLALQEIIWQVRPDLIVETGVAHGGSLVFYASMLQLLGGGGRAIGVDIDIRPHNRLHIENHPLSRSMVLVEGSSIDPATVRQVYDLAKESRRVLLALDSNHRHAHVLRELQLYSPLVKRGSYIVVFDTLIEDLPRECFADRPWGKGDNPKTAVHEFLKTNDRFRINKDIEAKLLITVAPDGWLECVKD
jgi:cephalosporin hydroxylase